MRVRFGGGAIAGVVLLVQAGTSAAQTVTDVEQTIRGLLNNTGPQPVTRSQTVEEQEFSCFETTHGQSCRYRPVTRVVRTTSREILTASNIRIVANTAFAVGRVTKTDVPSRLTAWDQIASNCNPQPASVSVTISKQTQHTESVAIMQGLQKVRNYQVSGQYKIGDLTLGTQVTFGQTETSQTTNTTSDATTTTRSAQGSTTVPPRNTYIVRLQVYDVAYAAPFTVNVTVDADLSPNDNGWTLLSQAVANAQLTFPVTGTITSTQASEGKLVFLSAPFDPAQCPATPNGVVFRERGETPLPKLLELSPQ